MCIYKATAFVLATLALTAGVAQGYVDMAPTLGTVVREAQTIAVAEVERFSPEKGVVVLKLTRALKGEISAESVKHQVGRGTDGVMDRHILTWAEPGRRCVVFVSATNALVCTGEGWYQVHASADQWWRLGAARPDLPLAYYGHVSRLADALERMLAGKTAKITTLPHGAGQEGASVDVTLHRASLPGLVKVQRIRAHLRMPGTVLGVSMNPTYLVGPGAADEDDLPALIERLHAADATVRAESAADLGTLGSKAEPAVAELAGLLDDPRALVRLAGAAALLRVNSQAPNALDALRRGLTAADPTARRQAIRAAGLAGPGAAPLAEALGKQLAEGDPVARCLALQAIATLGPSAAAARDAVVPLLDRPETAIDAADALGRIGPAARPAAARLVKMLDAENVAERWAAVRALAQIGSADAAPAADFMARELRTASEVDTYNMLIYLALLGPVARDTLPAVREARIRNPFLRQATLWAIDPTSTLPWMVPMGDSSVARLIFGSYVSELGEQHRPTAKLLAEKIMAGTAGDVPPWGYKLLARFPDTALPVLAPGLADGTAVVRERAAVALGYMGGAAAPAVPQVTRALAGAPGEKERRLLGWCLRELEAR